MSRSRVIFKRSPVTVPVWPRGFQEVKASIFHDIRHMKIVRLSASRTGRLYPQEMFLVLIFTRGGVDPRSMVPSEGNMSLKNTVTPPGIDHWTVRLVAQCLNRYATPDPRPQCSLVKYINYEASSTMVIRCFEGPVFKDSHRWQMFFVAFHRSFRINSASEIKALSFCFLSFPIQHSIMLK